MKLRMRSASLVLVSACGRIGFSPLDDAGALADTPSFGAFGTPTRVADLESLGGDDDPSLTSDLLSIVFDSDRGGADEMYIARRFTPQDAWQAPQLVAGVFGAMDGDPGIALDGLTLHVSSTRTGSLGQDDIWIATRPDPSAEWMAPVHVIELASADRDSVPQVTADGLAIFFASTRSGASLFDLYVATRPTIGDPWSTPVPLTELNSGADEVDPHFCEIEDALYFSSSRPGGLGSRDIYRARRTGAWSFAPPELVAELNTPGFDSDPWLSPDGHTIFLVNDQGGDFGIAMAVR